VLVVRLEGGLFAGTADYIVANVHRAEADGTPVLVLVDTPGGALDATRDIVKAFLGARVPILVWVGPAGARAGSAGVFVTMAANVAAMAPHTNIGAAHPIGMGVGAPGEDREDDDDTPGRSGKRRARDEQEVMAQKVENDTLAFIESIATARHRNVQWALSAVKDSVSVTAEKALELDVIDLLASDVDTLLREVDGRVVETAAGPVTLRTAGAERIEVAMTVRQRLIAFLSDPNLVYILFVVGMLGIYLELSHPGAIVPAVVGGVSLLLALTGLSVLPYNATGLIFLVLAGVCFVAEAYVTSFGLLALGGAVSLVLGAILLFDSGVGPEGLEAFEVAVSPWVYGSVAALALAFVIPIAWLVARAQTRRPVSGREGLIGATGRAVLAVDARAGRVFVHGEYWEARSSLPIDPGEDVVVTGLQGLTLEVGPRRG
jgi:membrane-bound serine protease (ClpP class)